MSHTDPHIPLPRLIDVLDPLQEALDSVDAPHALNWMHGLGFWQLQAMFNLAVGQNLRSSELAAADGSVTVCQGKNGLPVFTRFQKRFARVGEEIVGYNHVSRLQTFFVGHGHFVAIDSPDVPGEVWFDYTRTPAGQHPAFPTVQPNTGFLPGVVYGDMIDVVRRVSQRLLIGYSFKPSGRWGLNAGQYFAILLPVHQ